MDASVRFGQPGPGDMVTARLQPSQDHAPSKAGEVLKYFAYESIECVVAEVGCLSRGPSEHSLDRSIGRHLLCADREAWLREAEFESPTSNSARATIEDRGEFGGSAKG